MRRALTAIALLSLVASISSFAQENVVRVGVAVMENFAGRSVPGNVERDRLVKSINQLKPDKKTHLKVEAVPLNATTSDEAGEEAEQAKCQYVVYTKLTELRSASDPYQHTPGTVETNPNSQWNPIGHPQAQQMDPEYRATVQYKLVKVGGSVVSGAPFSTQQNGNEIDTVGQIMDRIANQVTDQVRKGTPPMKE
jgi:hypothetical protein